MGVFLTILKIIGIVLLSIIGLLLFLVLLILIAPIHYKAKLKAHDGIEAHAKVRYLLILTAPVEFVNNELTFAVKVFGITVFSNKKKEKKEKKKKEKPKEEILLPGEVTSENVEKQLEIVEEKAEASKTEVKAETVADATKTTTKTETKKDKKEAKKAKKAKKKGDEFALDDEDLDDEDLEDKKEKPKKPFKEKINDKWEWLKHALAILSEGSNSAIKSVQVFFKRKSTRYSIPKIKNTLIKIILHIRPRKLKGSIEFGFDDPAVTGYACAGASLLYGFYCNNFELTPDFTGKKLEGDVELKGHIILGYIVIKGLGLIIRKKVRQFIKNIKALVNEETENISKVKEGILDYERD